MPTIGPIAQAIAEVAKVVGQWMNSSGRRRIMAALEAAERYIFVNEKEGEYSDISEEKQKKYLAHFRKRFFHYNN